MANPHKAKLTRRPSGGVQSRGQKRPFTHEEVQLIRARLAIRNDVREIALFETALSTCLRSSDLLALRVLDVEVSRSDLSRFVVDKLSVRQRKTGSVVMVALKERARAALAAWIMQGGLTPPAKLFAFSRQYYGSMVKGWARIVGADPRAYSTHSMRRTLVVHLYRKTHNHAAAAKILGHGSLAQTIAYLGVDIEEAHRLSEEHDI